jgi:hypothetical protein
MVGEPYIRSDRIAYINLAICDGQHGKVMERSTQFDRKSGDLVEETRLMPLKSEIYRVLIASPSDLAGSKIYTSKDGRRPWRYVADFLADYVPGLFGET